MSPEVALLVRAALLGVFVFAIERFSRRRQARRAELRRADYRVIKLPVTQGLKTALVSQPVQVSVKQLSVKQKSVRPAQAAAVKPGQTDILKLEPRTAPVYVAEKYPFDGHVTEKRAA